jgi:hypothetical protein
MTTCSDHIQRGATPPGERGVMTIMFSLLLPVLLGFGAFAIVQTH